MPQRLAFAAFALSIGLLPATVGTAQAQPWDGYGPDRRRERWEHERWERERWERLHAYQRQYPRPGYYAPPPVFYTPPPVYYPPPLYTVPSVGLTVPFR